MIKNISAIAWAISSCSFLWFFSWSQVNTLPPHPTSADLFNSFLTFSFLLLGGGACYHFLTEIIFTPYRTTSFTLWKKLCYHLVAQMVSFISVPVILLFSRDRIPQNYSFFSGLAYFLFAYLFGIRQAIKVNATFKEIKKNI